MGLPKPIYWHNFLIVNDEYNIIFHIIWEKMEVISPGT
jgi:hypothetical protein